jgi:hypothetical protein
MQEFEQGHDMVGEVAIFMVCEWFLLESAKDWLLGVDPQDNMCYHVSGMDQFAH